MSAPGFEFNLQDPQTLALCGILLLVTVVLLSFLGGSKKQAPVALNKDEFIPFPLIDVLDISHDVKRFRFGLQSPKHKLGLPIGQHISLKYVDEQGNEVQRSYTPTSSDDELGYVDFVIKVYYPLLPRFPEGGKLSQHLAAMKIGETILMKGPKGHLDYLGKGKFTIKKLGEKEATLYQKKKIGMIAGGTGITPMLQVIRAILKNPEDKTQLWLIFANQSEEDILLRKELEAIPNDRLHLYYTLDRPPENWKYGSGFINTAMCRDHLPAPGPDSMIFVCGPPPMIKFACEPAFKELNFQPKDWFSF